MESDLVLIGPIFPHLDFGLRVKTEEQTIVFSCSKTSWAMHLTGPEFASIGQLF